MLPVMLAHSVILTNQIQPASCQATNDKSLQSDGSLMLTLRLPSFLPRCVTMTQTIHVPSKTDDHLKSVFGDFHIKDEKAAVPCCFSPMDFWQVRSSNQARNICQHMLEAFGHSKSAHDLESMNTISRFFGTALVRVQRNVLGRMRRPLSERRVTPQVRHTYREESSVLITPTVRMAQKSWPSFLPLIGK